MIYLNDVKVKQPSSCSRSLFADENLKVSHIQIHVGLDDNLRQCIPLYHDKDIILIYCPALNTCSLFI